MPSRKRTNRKPKLKLRRPSGGQTLFLLSIVWLGYRALTNHLPFDVARMESQGVPPPPGGWREFTKQVHGFQGKINQEHAALEDIGNPDGVSRLPAATTPTVSIDRLTAHCPSLGSLKTDTWIEIDEMGQVLSLESKDSGNRPSLAEGQFEPYRDATGRPLSVRALYRAAK